MTIRKTHLSLLAAGMIAAVSGFSGQAQAGAVGYASLDISGLKLIDSGTGLQLDLAAFTGYSRTVNSNALGGVNLTSTGNIGSTDVPLACVGACGMGQNNFSLQPVLASGTFARGDALAGGAAITGTANNGAGGYNSTGVAETQILAGGGAPGTIGSGSSVISTTARFTFANDTVLQMDFSADPLLLALLDGIAQVPGSSTDASISFQIKITHRVGNATVTDFEWNPDGSVGGISGGLELADPFSLNTNVAATATSTSELYDPASGFFSARTSLALLAGTTYSLSISQTQNANATDVPEPATLGLFGLGLAGLGYAARRRKARMI